MEAFHGGENEKSGGEALERGCYYQSKEALLEEVKGFLVIVLQALG
jgi:hypothetical protein